MIRKRTAIAVIAMASNAAAFAGGINTNSNMGVAFDRTLSRDAIIAADGVYFNPAGVAFMPQGLHIAAGWQLITQKRYIDNEYPLYANNTNDPTTKRRFKGTSLAPFFPTVQVALNRGRFSWQLSAGVSGGGGKCTFDDGLGSFEKLVSETAMAASGLAQTVDASLAQTLLAAGLPEQTVQGMAAQGFSSDANFGKKGNYSADVFMRGRQYYYGVQVGMAYRFNDNLSAAVGVRGVYASCNYYGYVRNIKVGNMPLYRVLDPSRETSGDVELNCDQSGFGVTPIIGIDFKTGRWNFAAKYEFKTRMRLKNEAVNQIPSIGNLSDNLGTALVGNLQKAGLPAATAQAVAQGTLQSRTVTTAMATLKKGFDSSLGSAISEYEDGEKVAEDLPAILTVGASYTPIDEVRLNAGFHYYFDKQAKKHANRNKLLDRGTIEYSFGAEYDPAKWITVSAGYQRTSYGLSDEYMDDKSFVVSSNNVGCGFAINLTHKTRLNVAYFHSFYDSKKTSMTSASTGLNYTADYTRRNDVIGAGVEIDL